MHWLVTGSLVVLSLLTRTRAQRGVTRACSLQIVTDPLLWDHIKNTVLEDENLLEDEAELVRVARFRLSSLTSRLVNTANSVLDRYYFSNTKYKLVLNNVKVMSL